MIDLQPFAEPIPVETRVGRTARRIGTAHDTDDKKDAMRAALRAVEACVASGKFREVGRELWTLEMHHTDHEAWQAFMDKPARGVVDVDPARLDEALRRDDGRVVTFEEDVAIVCQRVAAR